MTTFPLAEAGRLDAATPFERTLLRTASLLDHYVALRLARRSSDGARRREHARERYANSRADAQSMCSIGLMPR